MTADQAALEWVRRALEEETHDPAEVIQHRAEMLLQIAEEHSVSVEDLVQWIHFRTPEKRWTEVEWMRWIVKFTQARAELLQLQAKSEWRKLCPRCGGEPAHRVGDRWQCAKCGEVE